MGKEYLSRMEERKQINEQGTFTTFVICYPRQFSPAVSSGTVLPQAKVPPLVVVAAKYMITRTRGGRRC